MHTYLAQRALFELLITKNSYKKIFKFDDNYLITNILHANNKSVAYIPNEAKFNKTIIRIVLLNSIEKLFNETAH